MIVCICEKPSVALEVAKVLGARTKKEGYYEGNGYQVTWTFGHLCELKSPDKYYPQWKKWSMSVLPMIPPQYEVELINNPGIKKQFKVIKDLYKKADSIVNCGDAGQEGELIQRWVMQLAGVKCPVKRLWISSLTEEAIRQGFQNLKPQSNYDSLFEAGLARAEGDWLLGMNATRLFTLKYGGCKQVLSIGRVQTPTLAMIVARDNEIEHFVPKPYWVLTTNYRGVQFTCSTERFESEKEAKEVLAFSETKPLVIADVYQNKGTEQPPQLYDLTALQIDCNHKFGFSAETTLRNIQSLYEKKLTSYPRVDTKFLTDDIYTKCPNIIQNLSKVYDIANPLVGILLPKSERIFDNSKVTDHHAIIPTGDIRALTTINDFERKVYDLIVRRFLAVFYPSCEYIQKSVLASIGRFRDYNAPMFKATGRTIIKKGWRAVLLSEGEDDTSLPNFTEGESGPHIPVLSQKSTMPPKRYTDASLLQYMESINIGRPSSRAAIIETLLKRGYIRRDKKTLVSNPTGRNLIDLIHSKLLKSPELTALWEGKLRDIEHNEFSLDDFMKDLEYQLITIIKEVQSK